MRPTLTATRRARGPIVLAVIGLSAVAAACVPPHPTPPPPTTPATSTSTTTTSTSSTTTSTSTTTTSSTTSTTAAPSGSCQDDLQAFLTAANAGTYTSPAFEVDLSGATPLDNPTTSGGSGSASTQTITFAAHDEDGDVVAPTPSNPLVVDVYGGGSRITGSTPTAAAPGADPLTLVVTSGSTFSFDYDGGYLGAPLTVQAFLALGATNPCTGTPSYSLGATTVPLGNAPTDAGTASATLPATCDSGPAGSCAEDVVDTTGIRLAAAVGFAAGSPTGTSAPAGADPDDADYHDFTVDTGSLGVAVPGDELGPNAVGPAGPSYKYYDSSGFEYVGYLYLTPLTLRTDSGTVTTIPIRVLAVFSSGCYPGSGCTTPPDPDAFHYLGVGFDRNTPSPSSPFASPTDNALLQLASDGPGADVAPGYILGGTGVTLGLSASDVAGFTTVPLTASSSVPGDWLTAPGFASVTPSGDTPQPQAGTVLVDTGITDMFVNGPEGTFHELDPTAAVGVMIGTSPTSPALSYSFDAGVGRTPAATGMNPSSVGLMSTSPGVYVNTGRHVLFQYDVLFDARRGLFGVQALTTPLR